MKTVDSRLKEGLREGDRDIFRHLFLNHSSGLIRYCTHITEDGEAAREIVQQLFLEIWDKRTILQITGSIKTYLYSSVYHMALNWLRAQKIRKLYAENPIMIRNWFASTDTNQNPDPLMLERIEKEIALLPDQCREVFTRSAILGLSHSEIAALLGLHPKTVENHMARARKILRDRLKKFL